MTTTAWIHRAALLAGDLSPQQVQAMARSGELHRLRPGRYIGGNEWSAADEQERHRWRAGEIAQSLNGRAVISHESAALLLGMHLPGGPIPRVHVTWPGSPGRRGTTNVIPHRGQLVDADLLVVDGVVMTTAARTVFDVARLGLWHRAISVADSALRLGLCSGAELVSVLQRNGRVPGSFRARRVIEFADGLAESVGESICRLRMAQLGLPPPTLQALIAEIPGVRVDFEFSGFRTVTEFDGRVKYGRLLKVGQEPGDAVFAEKVREDRIRDTGRECVRVIWADLGRGDALLGRFRAAFARAGFPDWQPAPGRFLSPSSTRMTSDRLV